MGNMYLLFLMLACAVANGQEEEVTSLGYENVPTVTVLTTDNFDSKVMQSNDIWCIKFYAPWCYYSQKTAPHWKQTSKNLKGRIRFGCVNAPENQELKKRFGIKSYPKIYMFLKNKNDPIMYTRGRTAEKMTSYFSALLGMNDETKREGDGRTGGEEEDEGRGQEEDEGRGQEGGEEGGSDDEDMDEDK